jgi:hypothetical protein
MVKQIEVKSMKSRSNLYHVPLRQWRKWDARTRQVFNEVYSAMVWQQEMFQHPKQEKLSRSHWKTVAWNAAWTAACAAT